MAHKLIKHSDDSAKITFILRRVPNARVFLLKRSEDGESLGIRRDGGTGEVSTDSLKSISIYNHVCNNSYHCMEIVTHLSSSSHSLHIPSNCNHCML